MMRADVLLLQSQYYSHIAIFLIFAFIAEFFLIRYPVNQHYASNGLWMSVSTPMVCAAFTLYGWGAGVWMDASITLFAGLINVWHRQTRARWAILNTSQSILCAAAAGLTYQWMAPHLGLRLDGVSYAALTLAFILYFAVNTLLVGGIMAILEGLPFRWLLSQMARTVFYQMVAMFPLTLLLTLATSVYGIAGLISVLIPFFALRQALLIYAKQNAFYHQTVRSLGLIMQRAHPYTGGHLQRVAQWGRMTAEQLGLPAHHAERVYDAALLHDLGKIVIDERILNKPSKLNDYEWSQIKLHPELGADILREIPFLEEIVPWIAHHHERLDGQGYPKGLKGDDIPIEARIIAVVDAFDAMVGGETPSQQRQYRRPKSESEALEELERHAGTQFDPAVVEVFSKIASRSLPGAKKDPLEAVS
ncbi:MAG: HD domain-containing protein [Fimbriimonadia bacterium]|nr:HD domain-containing protein [Fimbriimonadia bacterium]